MKTSAGNTATDRLCVAIIDAQPLFRAGVAAALRGCENVDLIAEGDSAAEALRVADKHPLDIMLIDIGISGGGSDAVATIARMWPAIRIVVLTTSERAEDVTACLQSGARGYILKHIDAAELLKTLRTVAMGEVYLSPSLGARLFAQAAAAQKLAASQPVLSDLTAREEQILTHVSVGATNKEIARTLKISEKTVKYYMTNIMQKLQVRNRVEAVVAIRDRAKHTA